MKYIPKEVLNDFSELDYSSLYDAGYCFIISDLDNTLASYKDEVPSITLKNKINEIKKIGYKIYLVSNNNDSRISKFCKELELDGYLAKCSKPNPRKIMKFMEKNNIESNLTIGLGDQLVTDILCFNRLSVYSVLVKTIDKKTQKWYTKINRLREKRIIKNIKKINNEIGSKIESYE